MSSMGPSQDTHWGVLYSLSKSCNPKAIFQWEKTCCWSEVKPNICPSCVTWQKGEIQFSALLWLKSFNATSTHHQDSWPLGLRFHFLLFQIVWSHFKNSNNEKVTADYDIAFLPQTCWLEVNAIILRYGKCMKVFMYLNMHGEIWCYLCSDISYGQNRVTEFTFKTYTYFLCAVGQQCRISSWCQPCKGYLKLQL